MRITAFFVVFFVLSLGHSRAQRTDKQLETKIINAIQGFRGEVGIYIKNLQKNREVNIDGDKLFPTASIVKVPILVGVFQKISEGQLRLDQKFTYRDDRQYGGSGLMQFFKDSVKTDLATLVSLMLSYSDNVTSIWNQELAGGGASINPLMESLGFSQTRVNSRTPGRASDWQQYGWGQTTAKEMSRLFDMIRNGDIISPAHSDKMYRFLKNQFYNEGSLSQFPATVNCISKTGALNDARGEVVLVNAPNGDIVFTILTKNNEDQRWTKENEADVLIRKIARIVWNHYEKDFRPFEL